ncbi:MAG TPA: regulatory iron-sulfur-containing complex subunit RicT [Phycisphaerae bacterium]|nr:regulatory iron-sulfur-containing complex subunit RicT [Phycisphaerae bacterium]
MSDSAPPEGEGLSAQTPPQPSEGQDPPESQADEESAAPPQETGQGEETASNQEPQQDRPKAASQPKPRRPSVVARYGLMGSIGEFRHNLDPAPPRDTKVVIRTERGVELGCVVAPVGDNDGYGWLTAERLREFSVTNGPEYPFRRDGRVLRRANPQDVIDYRHLQQSAGEAAGFCRQQIKELGLEMRLVTVEHLLGGERIVFYFSAEQRVDFRELVRRLASQYRTRIEMRQVGARDEARLVADFERCGQQCCCQRFLKYLKPVSMRMAKTQKATLDPSKISGRCGRLMCCLKYEDETYDQLRKALPRKNTWIRTDQLVGRVIDTQILAQLAQVQLMDGSRTAVPIEEILERDVEPPTRPPARAPVAARFRPAPARAEARKAPAPDERDKDRDRAAAEDAPSGPAEEAAAAESGPAEGKRPRRRRRSRRKRDGAQGLPAEAKPKAAPPTGARPQPQPDEAPAKGEGSGPKKEAPKKRPRRRRGGGKKRRQD